MWRGNWCIPRQRGTSWRIESTLQWESMRSSYWCILSRETTSSRDSHRAHSLKRTHKNASLGERRRGKVWNRKAQRELCTHQAGVDIESIEGATWIKAVERVTPHDGREIYLFSGVPINRQLRSCWVQDPSQAVGARHKDLGANRGSSSHGQPIADFHRCRLT